MTLGRLNPTPVAAIVFAAAVMVLAIHPLQWLAASWREPAFASDGLIFFLATLAVFLWSGLSPLCAPARIRQRIAIGLFALTASVRLLGQVWAIDTISALALAIDVYAIGLLLGLQHRARAVSPLWLAVAFTFSLPIERIVQRLIGFGLQTISASGACSTLELFFSEVECSGVRITVEGADVLVDLPCSGAQALVAFGFTFVIVAALTRPSVSQALIGVGAALCAAIACNIARITLLASGIAIGPDQLGFDVMAQPWHDLAGALAWVLYIPVLWAWAAWVRSSPAVAGDAARRDTSALKASRTSKLSSRALLVRASLCLGAALIIICAPAHPPDATGDPISVAAPPSLGPHRAQPQPLSDMENAYFAQFGGAAAKASYGPFSLLLTRTSAPLRHLHAPDECLRGLGFQVDYVGARFSPAPTSVYRAIDPDGTVYRIEVSFISQHGRATGNIAEAVWLWLRDRSDVWTSVQRISAWDGPPTDRIAFETAVMAALDQPSERLAQGTIHLTSNQKGE